MAIGMRSSDAEVVEIVDDLLGHRTIGDTSTLVRISVEALMAQVVTQAPLWAALRDTAPTAGTLVVTDGYYSRGDGGGGVYLAYSGAAPGTYLHDGVASIRPLGGDGSAAWVLVDPEINLLQAGAKGDASVNVGYASFTATASGSSRFVTVSSADGLAEGMHVATRRYASRSGVAIPTPTTILSVSGTTVELSRTIASGTHKLDAYWLWDDAGVSGTDDTAAILGALGATQRTGRSVCRVPGRQFKCGDTAQIGYGNEYRTLALVGPEDGGAFAPGGGGAQIFFTAKDRPAVTFSGARRSKMERLAIWGPGYCYGWLVAAAKDPSPVIADHLAPELVVSGSASGGLQTAAPLVGVSVDPFAGSTPATPYPRTIPSWTGLTQAYGTTKLSSDVAVRDCSIGGFGVCEANGSTQTSQQDYYVVEGCQLSQSPIATALGADQGRNSVRRRNKVNCVHTWMTGGLGRGQGKFGGDISSNSISAAYQLLDFNGLGYSNPLIIRDIHAEFCVRGGRIVGTGAGAAVVFEGGMLDFGDNVHGQSPAAYFEGGTSQAIVFRGCEIVQNRRLQVLVRSGGLPDTQMDAVTVLAPGIVTPADGSALRKAINGGGTLMIGASRYNTLGQRRDRVTSCMMPYAKTTGEALATRIVDEEMSWYAGGQLLSRVELHDAAKRFTDLAGSPWTIRRPGAWIITIADTNTVHIAPSISGDAMTIGLKDTATANAYLSVAAGWRAYHPSTGTLFLVTSVGTSDGTGKLVTTQQQNNLDFDIVSGAVTANGLVTADLTGDLIFIPPGAPVPSEVFYAVATATSTTLASIQKGDGTASALATYWVSGDTIWSAAYGAAWPVSPYTKVTVGTVTAGSPGSMTISAGAAVSGNVALWPYPIA